MPQISPARAGRFLGQNYSARDGSPRGNWIGKRLHRIAGGGSGCGERSELERGFVWGLLPSPPPSLRLFASHHLEVENMLLTTGDFIAVEEIMND